jgi:hypothetical protein
MIAMRTSGDSQQLTTVDTLASLNFYRHWLTVSGPPANCLPVCINNSSPGILEEFDANGSQMSRLPPAVPGTAQTHRRPLVFPAVGHGISEFL